MKLLDGHKEPILLRVFDLDIFSLSSGQSIADDSLEYPHTMKEMHHRIACLYLDEQIQLRSLLASEDSTQKWSNQLISNDTLTVEDKRRATKFPRMNPCFYLIIRTKLLHHRCLFGENENIFLFL
jgi:hypothetical protein